jgi:hypothetical protein
LDFKEVLGVIEITTFAVNRFAVAHEGKGNGRALWNLFEGWWAKNIKIPSYIRADPKVVAFFSKCGCKTPEQIRADTTLDAETRKMMDVWLGARVKSDLRPQGNHDQLMLIPAFLPFLENLNVMKAKGKMKTLNKMCYSINQSTLSNFYLRVNEDLATLQEAIDTEGVSWASETCPQFKTILNMVAGMGADCVKVNLPQSSLHKK